MLIDSHCHVALLDDPRLGRISDWMRRQLSFRILLKYARITEPSNAAFREMVLRLIDESRIAGVVCLALDPVYDEQGRRREDLSQLWVDNDYVCQLRDRYGGKKVLLGASVHPYDRRFEERVRQVVAQGAVLLKWLPSAQHIELADPRVLKALRFTATAGEAGRALPVLLHVGPEYAIVTSDARTTSADFLTWSSLENSWNRLRPRDRRWKVPPVQERLRVLRAAVADGAHIILAHAGLPYYAPNWLAGLVEHSDLPVVRSLLAANQPGGGAFYADVSACCTPFRQTYFAALASLPKEYVLFGSDFPVPVFELTADYHENLRDLRAVMRGELDRVVIPQDNLLDVNYRELSRRFPDHPMFRNFAEIFGTPAITAGSTRGGP